LTLERRTPPEYIYRVSRSQKPWVYVDWFPPEAPPELRGRFDAPDKSYGVLYGGSQPIACFAETMAKFRLNLKVLAELAKIKGLDDYPATRIDTWIESRYIAKARVAGIFADIYSSEWMNCLHDELATTVKELGRRSEKYRNLKYIDVAIMQSDQYRELTQAASRIARNRGFNGIYYRSRFGHDFENWAIFEPFGVTPEDSERLDPNDPDLRKMMALYGLTAG